MKSSRSAIAFLANIIVRCYLCAMVVCTVGTPTIVFASEINQNGVPFKTATTIEQNGNLFNISTKTTNHAGDIGINTFGRFNVSQGDTVNLNLINQQNKLVNLVFDSSATQIDGVVNSFKNGQIGGNILFANPNGFVIGKTGVFNVGSLTLMTPTEDSMKKLFDSNSVNGDMLNSLVSFKFNGDDYVLYDGSSAIALYPSSIQINGTINSGSGIDLLNGGNKIEVGATGALNANMNFSGTGSHVTATPKSSVTPNTKSGGTYKFAMDGGNGVVITSSNGGVDRDYLSAIVNLSGKVKANGGDVNIQTEIYQMDAKEDESVSQIHVKNGSEVEGAAVTMRAFSHILSADTDILGVSGSSSDWLNILDGSDILNHLIEDFVHLGDLKTQVTVEDGAKINAIGDLTLKAEATLYIEAYSVFENFAFNLTDLDILTEARVKSGANIKAKNLTVQSLTDFYMANNTIASSLVEIVGDAFRPFGNYGAYALNISLLDMANRAIIENGARLDVSLGVSVLASMLRDYIGTVKNGLLPVVDRNRGSAGLGFSVIDFSATNEAIMNADLAIGDSLVVNADYTGGVVNTITAWSAAAGEDGNFGLGGRIAQAILGHGKFAKVFDFLETSVKSRAEATFNKIQIAGAINVGLDEIDNHASIGDAEISLKPTITAKNVVVGATLLDNKSQVYASSEADNGETTTSGALVVNYRKIDSNADVFGDLTLTGSDADHALVIRSKTDIQHMEGLWDWLKQSAAGWGLWEPTEKKPDVKNVTSSNVDDYLAQYGMSDDYQYTIDEIGRKMALTNMVNFNDIGLNGLFGSFASSQANAASKGGETKAWAGAVSVAVTNASSNAVLEDGSNVNILASTTPDAKQNILIDSSSVSEVWSGAVLMSLFNATSLFGGMTARDGDSAGGSLSIAATDIDTTAKIGKNVTITGQNSDVTVLAEEKGEFINIGNGTGTADNAGLGGEFVVSAVTGGTTSASVEKGAKISLAKDVTVQSARDDVFVNASFAYTNSQKSKSFGISPLVVSNTVKSYVAGDITASGKVAVDASYDKIIVNSIGNFGMAKIGTDNPVFTDLEPSDDSDDLANLDVLFEELSVIPSPVDPSKYVKTDFSRPLNATKETSAYAGNIITNIFLSDITAYVDDDAKIVADSLKVGATSSDLIVDAGAVVAVNGKSGGGATILFDMSKNQIDSYIGKAVVDVTNDLTVSAEEDYTMIDVQAGIAQAKDSSGVGNLSINLQLNEINAGIKDGAKINTNLDKETQSVKVSADLENRTVKAVGALSIQVGGSDASGAKGATLDANVYVNDVNAYIDKADVNAGKSFDVAAGSTATVVGVDVAGAGSAGDTAYAGTLGTYISNNSIDAHIDGANINQTSGRTNNSAKTTVKGTSDYSEVAVVGTIAGGKSTAAGGSVSARILADTIDSYVKDTDFDSASSLSLENNSTIHSVAVAVAGSGSSSGNAVDGAIMVVVDAMTQNNYIDGSSVNVDSITLKSNNDYDAVGVTGALAISGGKAAVGGSIYVSVTDNDLYTYIHDSDVATHNDISLTSDVMTDSLSIIFAGGGGKGVAAAGAVSTVVNSPDAETYVSSKNGGKKAKSVAGKVKIHSQNKATLDTINVVASGGSGKAEVGAAINTVVDSSDISAGSENMEVTASGDVDVEASSTEKIMSISVGGAGGSGVAVAGSVNTMVIAADTDAYLKNSVVDGNSVKVASSGTTDITGGTGAADVSTGSAAIGASIVTGVIDNSVTAVIEDSKVDANQDVTVNAEASETIGKSDAPFITIAGGFSEGVTVEGVVDTMILSGTADAHIKGKKSIDGVAYGVTAGEDVSITGKGEDTIFAIGGAVSTGVKGGVGATVNTVVVDKDVKAYAKDAKITAGQDIQAEATETDDFFTTVVAASVAGTAGGSGVVNTNVVTSDLEAGYKDTELKAANEISSNAKANAEMQTITGSVGGGGTLGIGLSVVNDILRYRVNSYATEVDAEFKDLSITGSANSNYQFTTVSGGMAGTAGVAGVENVNYVNNSIQAYADGVLKGDKATDALADTITIRAEDQVKLNYPIAGQVSIGGTAGVGATVMVNTVTSTVEASLGGSDVKAKEIEVASKGDQSFDNIIAAGFSGGGTAGVTGTVLVNDIDTTIHSYVADLANIYADELDVTADNEVSFIAFTGAGAVGGSGAFGASVNVNHFSANTEAYTGKSVSLNAKDVTVSTKTETDLGKKGNPLIVAAGSAGLYAGIAGSVMWNTIENKTAAYIGTNNVIHLADSGKMEITAQDTTNIHESLGAGGAGIAGIGASVGGIEIGNTVLAFIGTGTNLIGKNADVSLDAKSTENVDALGVVIGGGIVGLSGGAVLSSIGKRIDNASYNDFDKEEKKTFTGANSQATSSTSKADEKNDAGDESYKTAYNNALDRVSGDAEGTRIASKAKVTESLFVKTGSSSIPSTDRDNTTSAYIDSGVLLNARDLKITANNTNDVSLETDGLSVGAGAVGVSAASSDDFTTTNAFVSNGVTLYVDNMELHASSKDKQTVDTLAAQGGIIAGGGSTAQTYSGKTTNAYVLKDTSITTAGNLDLLTESKSELTSNAKSGAFGGVAVGLSLADATASGSTKIDVKNDVQFTSLTGNITLKTDVDNAAEANAWAAAGGVGGGAGSIANAITGTDDTINIGANFSATAKGDLTISANAKNDSYAESNGRAYGVVSGGGANGFAAVYQTYAGVTIADADAPTDPDAKKKIKAKSVSMESNVDNYAETEVYAGAGALLGGSGSKAEVDIRSTNSNYVGDNFDIETTGGSYSVKADTVNEYKGYDKSDSYGVVVVAIPLIRNGVTSTVSVDSEADIVTNGAIALAASNEITKEKVSDYDLYGGAGGLANGAGGSIKDTLEMTTTAKLGGDKARAEGDFGNGRIDVSSYNVVSVNEKANLYSHGGIAGADTDSIVTLTAEATTEIANKDISNRDDHISYTARNDVDIYTKVNVESYGGVAGAGGRSEATSDSQKAKVVFDSGTKSVSGRDTNIKAISNKSLDAYINAETGGLLSIVGGRADAHNNDSQAYVTIKEGAEVKSFDVMNITATSSTQKLRAKRDALAYELGFIPYHGKGNEYTDNENSAGITIDGAVESGLGANKSLEIQKDGTVVSDHDNIRVTKEKVGEITPADIDADIEIYEQSKTDATKQYDDFKATQDNLIQEYTTAKNNAETQKNTLEAANKDYQKSIEIWDAIGDIESADFATKYADSDVTEIAALVEALQASDKDAITAAKTALLAKKPSESVAELEQHITTNNNSIANYNEIIATNEDHIEKTEQKIAFVKTQYDAQMAELDEYISELKKQEEEAAGGNIPVYSMLVDSIVVRSGETNLTGKVTGSGSITAPGDKFSIVVDNYGVSDVVYNDLILGRNLKGGIYGSSIASSITKTIKSSGSDFKISLTNHVDANDPTINSTNGFGDMVFQGNVENVNGTLDLTNNTGNILFQGSLTVKDLHIKAPNGGYSQVYVNQEMSTGGTAGSGAIVASGDMDISAKTINVNGLLQSGSEIKTVTIPDFSVVKEGGTYYQVVNNVKTEMKPSELTDGYYYLNLTDDTSDVAALQQIKAYFKPSDKEATEEVPGEIYLFKAGIAGGNITLTGNIVNDNTTGKIVLISGYGHIDVTNNSKYDLVTNALNADDKIGGTLTINDFKFLSGGDTTFDQLQQSDLTEDYLAAHAGKYTANVDENGNIVSTASNLTDGNGKWGETSSSTRNDGAIVHATTYTPGNDAYVMTKAGEIKSYKVYVKRSWWTELWYGKKYETRYYYEEPVYEVRNQPIAIHFQGFTSPQIKVVSNGAGNVIMNNSISAIGGDVQITTAGNLLTKNSKYNISADNITLTAGTSIGDTLPGDVFNPIQVGVYHGGSLVASADEQILVNFPYEDISDLDLQVTSDDGFIYLATSVGKFDGTGQTITLKSDALELRADSIHLDTTDDNVELEINKLRARAKDDITIVNKDDLVLSSIVSENKGAVTIESQNGSIWASEDTGTYSEYHINGGNITLKALNGSVGDESQAIKFANSGIFHVEAQGDISLDSAATMYVDKIESYQGNLSLNSIFGIIASAISEESRNYHISAGGQVVLYTSAGNIENIAIHTAKEIYAVAGYENTVLGGLSSINIQTVSDEDMKIGMILATDNVTLTSNKGIQNVTPDAYVVGENITLKATEDIGEQDSAIHLQANRAVTALTSGGKGVYLKTDDAQKGLKINRIDTNNGEGSLGNVKITSAGNITNDSDLNADATVTNVKAESIQLNAEGKAIGTIDRYFVVETTSEDPEKGLSFLADKAYILGTGNLLNITDGTSTGDVSVDAENTAIRNATVGGNFDSTSTNLTVTGALKVTGDAEIAAAKDVSIADVSSMNLTITAANADIQTAEVEADAGIVTTGGTTLGTATVGGNFDSTSTNFTVTDTLKVAGDAEIDAKKDANIADVTAGSLTVKAANADIQSAEVKADAEITTTGDMTLGTATVGGNFENTSTNTTVTDTLKVTGDAEIAATKDVSIADVAAKNLTVTAANADIQTA
ncbi:MAG: leukotoxin LktA family filamentous adhesin, partial [Victivallales bacterium]|nr:leukotoxin LktA family filamentous adhesin [Victivallales bacterium]